MKLIFASSNENKTKEIRSKLPEGIELFSLKDLNFTDEIPETGVTLTENAIIKAKACLELFNSNCFADDTGLEIEALNGEPGVYSARYAGEEKNPEMNMNLVLEKLNGIVNRKARFVTVIALIWNNEMHLFEGAVEGEIISEKRGNLGFGYDPIFIPENESKTFAEMDLDVKNKFSHRARATEKMLAFLNENLNL
jgi:XTP/dITP diphosphohydrolase